MPTVADKLQIKPGTALWFSPIEWLWLLGPLPPGVTMASDFATSTVAVVFTSDQASVRWFLDRHRTMLAAPRLLWVCYPKGGRADINRDTLWPLLAAHGLRPVGQVAIDATWSALRFRPILPGEPPFTGGR